MWVIRYFILTLLVLLVIAFIIQNSYQYVSVNLFNQKYTEVLLLVVLFEAFVLGIVFWFIISIAQFFKLHRVLSRQRKENKKLLEEIKAIRNMPLQEVDGEVGTAENPEKSE